MDNKPFLFAEVMPFLAKFLKTKKSTVILASIALVIVIVAVVYLFFQDKKTVNKILLSRESTLSAELTRMENKNDFLEANILILKNEVKSLSKKKDKKKLKKIEKYLADTEISGKGVEIILQDNSSFYASVQDENTIVHNTDLLKIVNFLWENDAVAIAVNGERMTINSHISCVGPTILVNKKRINSPFKISAVGENLDAEKIKNDGFVLSLNYRGIELIITQRDNILIPAGKYATLLE